ncbi:hypothetical protein RM550_09580 [Streptomyces sp. DSM 41527]|uniref:Uncharacterized protein n=1 Tax=Streptomyces mooreae TaxID=3075523 RepID=A0ABU2T5S0_9ACTN|nr:hypothetical protein [Streptomyces sp. DSM 41527]MDT0455989.1 hypothetical protein [Streptomyces sp. DSM 41527]
MKLSWSLAWIRHADNFGYSHGVLPGTIGTVAVLLTAVVLGFALHRVDRIRRLRFAAPAAAIAFFTAGVLWLAGS